MTESAGKQRMRRVMGEQFSVLWLPRVTRESGNGTRANLKRFSSATAGNKQFSRDSREPRLLQGTETISNVFESRGFHESRANQGTGNSREPRQCSSIARFSKYFLRLTCESAPYLLHDTVLVVNHIGLANPTRVQRCLRRKGVLFKHCR